MSLLIPQWLKAHRFLLILLVIYLGFNLLTLLKYPKVYHDEGYFSYTASLLLQNGWPILHPNISQGEFFKETGFFPLWGSLFYGSLAILGKFAGFSLYAQRLHPLLFSLLSLILIYKIALTLFDDKKKAHYALFFMAASSIFLRTSHMIRQESMFITFLLAMYYYFIKGLKKQNRDFLFISSFLAGLSITIHPNGIFLPLVLLALFFSQKKQWKESFYTTCSKMALFASLGISFFFLLDFLPHQKHYWDLFFSPYYANTESTTRILSSIFFPLRVIKETLIGLYDYFLIAYHHAYFFYFILNITAIGGAFIYKSHQHKMILITILLIFLMLFLLRASLLYPDYFLPFFCLLFSSVFIEWKKKTNYLKRIAISAFLAVYLLHSLIVIWLFRNYNFHAEVKKIEEKIGSSNFLASSIYYFHFPQGNLYPDYMLAGSKLETLVSKLNIKYLVTQGPPIEWITGYDFNKNLAKINSHFLTESCKKEILFKEYQPSLLQQSNNGYEITLFDCQPKH